MSFYARRDYRNYRNTSARRDYAAAPTAPAVTCNFSAPKWVAFKAVQPVRAQWVETKAGSPNFDFPEKMYGAVIRFGDLTQGQGEAIDRMIARDAERTTRPAQPAYNNGLDCGAVRAALAAFSEAGRRRPSITVEGFEMSWAPMTGTNPGAIYVKDNGQYVGKIAAGTEAFLPGRDFNPERMPVLQAIFRDPRGAVQAQAARIAAELAAAQAEGRPLSLPCGCCGITLTDPVSIARGIGPICASKWGF